MTTIDAALFNILEGYSSLAPPNSFFIPSYLPPAEIHSFFLSTVLLNPYLQQYPPSRQYQKTFWKWAIHAMEDLLSNSEDGEIDPRFYDHYLSIQEAGNNSVTLINTPPSQSYITYYRTQPYKNLSDQIDMNSLTRITLFESRTTIESGTTGLRTWKASFILADYLFNNPELIQGKSVLELGSGTGFLGAVIAMRQQQNMLPGTSLYLTDVNEQVLLRCHNNINLPCNLSSLHPHTHCRILDWSLSLDDPPSYACQEFLAETNADLIVGADIVFDPSLIPALVGMLKLSLSIPVKDLTFSKKALIALTIRNADTMAAFVNSVKDSNLKIDEIELRYQRVPFVHSVSLDMDSPVKIFQITPCIHDLLRG
ncbi:hypothetical protein AX15_005245 [Amanita polypyramis BW_CC]|nr:hypothetical protein AX15_005245 [Amanita polypyramis BW_CC]